jgi:hypothetical protein
MRGSKKVFPMISLNDPEPEKSDIDITPEMIRVGVGAYLRWNPDEEEPEALVAEIFFEMSKRAKKSS